MFKKKKDPIKNLVDELKKHPDQMYVGDKFIACYIPAMDKAVFIYGNFTNLSDLELNNVLVNKVTELLASMN